VQSAVDAMKRGAVDYVLRPFDADALEAAIHRALAFRRIELENEFLRERLERRGVDLQRLLGSSAAMRAVSDLIAKVAPTRSPVLITGETGTGKELAAHAIHRNSPRASELFVALNCAAIPSQLLESELFGHVRGAFTGADANRTGKFEVADGGTLFLDEIGDMPYELQSKLLRVLEEGIFERVGSNQRVDVDVRIVSSTNRDLAAAIRDGRFREDLYYRLNVFRIEMPPLRARLEDVPLLAQAFLDGFSSELGKTVPRLGDEAILILQRYGWPGNVRELRNIMERAAVLCEGPELASPFLRSLLPSPSEAEDLGDGQGLEHAVENLERKLILRALRETGDNKAKAARQLEVSERTLWYKLKKLGI
jgi:two-component system response regulator AtoC